MAPTRLSTWLAEPWLPVPAPAFALVVFRRAPRRKMVLSSSAHRRALPREIDPSDAVAIRIASTALRTVVLETPRAENAPGPMIFGSVLGC